MGLVVPAVQAAPGETWSGTVRVTQEVAYEMPGDFSSTSTYSKYHSTTFSFSHVTGGDDDPYTQAVASWETDFAETRSNDGGDGGCWSQSTVSGTASGTDGRLEIRLEADGQVAIEVLDYGSPGTFPATQTSQTCQDREPQNSSTTASHQKVFLRTSGDPSANHFVGSVTQGNGTNRFEWDLIRGGSPTDQADDLKGTPSDDVVELAGGNDRYLAGRGDDKVYGGAGDDEAEGGPGGDFLIGGDGGDKLSGNDGNDTIKGDGPNGFTHTDEKYSHAGTIGGPDFLFGGGGADLLTGGGGLDRFDGGPGRDTCIVDSRREKRRARGCEEIQLRRSR